ncbi:MAG: sodium:solute symporter [Acidimicrobiia bacterium]|nr:sodium:solute symporter [Acidimicrobiia bacterium]
MSATTAVAALLATLALFAVVGVTGRARPAGRDDYLAARGSQRAVPLALSLYASGMGVWILFTPPIVAAFGGVLGAVAYALAAASPLVAFGVLGPRVRRSVPAGITLTDWVRLRFGRPFQAYVAVVAVFYMFMFVTAELTAIGQVLTLPAFGAAEAWIGVVGTAAMTAAYTAYGGLPASLRTDRWQGWLILALLALGVGAIVCHVDGPLRAAVDGGLTHVDRAGVETIVVLVVAVTAANLFHQGYWQRMWAAADEASLRSATGIAAVLSLLTVLAVGLTGLVAAGIGEPSVPFFDLLAGLPGGIRLLIVVLAVALVASSVDTLENGMAALVAQDVSDERLGLGAARLVTVALIGPACLIAVQGHDILRLFLVADLVAAATVVPVFLGLGPRVTGGGAIAGSVAGLLAVFVLGVVTRGGVDGGWAALTIADSPALDVGAFVWAPAASAIVALAWSVGGRSLGASARPGHGPEGGLVPGGEGDGVGGSVDYRR